MRVVAQTHRLLTTTKALNMRMAIACTLDVQTLLLATTMQRLRSMMLLVSMLMQGMTATVFVLLMRTATAYVTNSKSQVVRML